MNTVRLATGLSLLGFAAFIAWEASFLRYMTRIGPGPGFFPLWLSGILGFVSGVIILSSFTGPKPEKTEKFWPSLDGQFRIASVLAMLIFAVLALERLGFRLTLLAVFLVLLTVMGRRDLPLMIAISLGGSFGAYQIFDWLGVRLPSGVFGF